MLTDHFLQLYIDTLKSNLKIKQFISKIIGYYKINCTECKAIYDYLLLTKQIIIYGDHLYAEFEK